MKRELSKLWLVALLAVGAFASCSKDDRTEPNSPTEQTGEAVTLSLSAEVGFEEEAGDFKALSFKLENVDGKSIPRPQLSNGDDVEVVTVIKSSTGTTYAKKMKWKYVEEKRILQLRHPYEGNDIAIPGFNNDGGKKWYIAGLIAPGATLGGTNGTQVSFAGTRTLQGVSVGGNTDLGAMNIPYWTGWMELTIMTGAPDVGTQYANAKVETTNNTFKPIGSLIAYKIGNQLDKGAPTTFTPMGFTVTSNAFSDAGTFDLGNTSLTDPELKWTPSAILMAYSFATAPSISHGVDGADTSNPNLRTYYAWVMPHKEKPDQIRTRVLLYGTSSDFTGTGKKRYLSHYTPTQNMPQRGKIHTLKANAKRPLILPIDYVTEYNLAGGGLLTSFNNVTPSQPEGIKGSLRFSNALSNGSPNPNPHGNDQSGYYSWYELMGLPHGTVNPGGSKKLQDEINTKWPNTYFVPEEDHLWGIWPTRASCSWSDSNPITEDYFQLGYATSSADRVLFHGSCEYTTGAAAPDNARNAVVYAIRFAKAVNQSPRTENWDYSLSSNSYVPRTYQPLTDNSLRCAYRFTRIGSRTAWQNSNNQNMPNQLKIDVVYLGEDPNVNSLSDIHAGWWSTKQSEGEVISRTFPAAGFVQSITSPGTSGSLDRRGYWASYWSASANNGMNAWFVYAYGYYMYSNFWYNQQNAFPVRLFRRDPDQ